MPSAVDIIFQIFLGVGQFLIYGGWLLILAVLVLFWKIRWAKWPVEAEIIEKRGSNLIKTNDRARRYIDPYTKLTGYRLLKSKDDIPVINYDWVLHNAFRPTNFLEWIVNKLRGNIGTIFLFRYGSKQYKPIKIREKAETKIIYKEIKDEKGNPVFIKVYQQLDPRDKLGILDFEVVDWDNMNFMVQEQRASLERRQKKSGWMKQIMIPLMIIGIAALVSIIMLKFSFDWAIAMKGTSSQTTQNAQPAKIPIIGDIIPGT